MSLCSLTVIKTDPRRKNELRSEKESPLKEEIFSFFFRFQILLKKKKKGTLPHRFGENIGPTDY